MEAVIGAQSQARVLIQDSGELDDVREVLAALGIDYAEVPGGRLSAGRGLDVALVVSTAKTLETAEALRRDVAPAAVHISVIDHADSEVSLKSDESSDFVVRRPVHAAVLRLLVERAIYRGPEKRARERVAIGAAVTLRSGLRSWVTTLLDLSLRSCRVQSSKPLAHGRKVMVRLPRRLSGGELLVLEGRVVRTSQALVEPRLPHEIAISFDSLPPASRRALRVVVEGHVLGPASLAPDSGVTRRAAIVENTSRMLDRRSSIRSSEAGLTAAARLGDRGLAARVLIGRDLSPEGMRVDREASIAEGDEFSLSLYGGARAASINVDAVVDRSDEAGSFLRFRNLPESAASRIEELVDGLVVSQRSRFGARVPARVVVTEAFRRKRAG